jgi:hypothetical protein
MSCTIIVNRAHIEGLFSKVLFLEERKEDCENDAYDDARRNGKVEAEPLFFYHYVAGKFPNEWNFVTQQETNSHYDEDDAENDEHLSDSRHYASL